MSAFGGKADKGQGASRSNHARVELNPVQSGICPMSAAAAIACGQASPLFDSNAAHNRASSAPTVRRLPCWMPVPPTRSEARVGAQLELRLAGGVMQCNKLGILAVSNLRYNRQPRMQVMPHLPPRFFAPRAAAFCFLILDDTNVLQAQRTQTSRSNSNREGYVRSKPKELWTINYSKVPSVRRDRGRLRVIFGWRLLLSAPSGHPGAPRLIGKMLLNYCY